jgi:hypothetical protein
MDQGFDHLLIAQIRPDDDSASFRVTKTHAIRVIGYYVLP